MQSTLKDQSQDELIAQNAERIARNEEAIRRQTEALEQIRDHYYPPPEGLWKKIGTFFIKVVCVVVAYLGIAQTLDWIWNVRRSDARAAQYAEIAKRLFAEQGDAQGAIACYEQAAKLNSKNSEYVIALTLMKGIALATDFFDNNRQPTYAERLRIDAALSEATVLKELDPHNPMPHVLMAQAFALSGDRVASTAAVERAVACAPKNASVQVSACAMQFFAGNYELAQAHLLKAKRLDAASQLVDIWQGKLKLEVDHDAKAAVECFRAAVRHTPRLALAHAMLARSMLRMDQPDLPAVRAALEHALQLDARQTGAMSDMAESYEREGNLVMARLWLDRVLSVNIGHLPALIARARIAGKRHDWEAAVADLTVAIQLATFRADLYRLRAEAYEQLGLSAKAKADRETFAALQRH